MLPLAMLLTSTASICSSNTSTVGSSIVEALLMVVGVLGAPLATSSYQNTGTVLSTVASPARVILMSCGDNRDRADFPNPAARFLH